MTETATLTTGWEPATRVDDSLLRAFVFSYADRVAWMAGRTGGLVDRDEDACIADAQSGFGYDNAAVLLRPPSAGQLAAVIRRAQALFGPERWWVLLSAWPLPGPEPGGLALVGHPPLMLRPAGQSARQERAGLCVREVRDTAALRDFETVLTEGVPLPAGGVVASPRLLGDHLRLYVGYVDGEPVGTAGASVAHGIVEVDWVSTVPGHRRTGVGAAMTLAATSVSPSLPSMLLASDDGRSLYRRLGFVDLLRLTIWEHCPPTDMDRPDQPRDKGDDHEYS